jgi:hypothetical protein
LLLGLNVTGLSYTGMRQQPIDPKTRLLKTPFEPEIKTNENKDHYD